MVVSGVVERGTVVCDGGDCDFMVEPVGVRSPNAKNMIISSIATAATAAMMILIDLPAAAPRARSPVVLFWSMAI